MNVVINSSRESRLCHHTFYRCFFQFSISRKKKKHFFFVKLKLKNLLVFNCGNTLPNTYYYVLYEWWLYVYLSIYWYLIGWSKCYFWASFNQNFREIIFSTRRFRTTRAKFQVFSILVLLLKFLLANLRIFQGFKK